MGNLIGKSSIGIAYFERMVLRLNLKSFNLLGSRLLRGREGSSLLVHALSHLFVFSLHFLLFSLFSFFFSLSSLFFFCFLFLSSFYVSCCFSLVLRCCLLCMAKAFLYCLLWQDLPFYPLTTFGLLWVSFLGHPLVCWLLSHHHYLVLATPHSIPDKWSFVLFSYFS